MDLFLLLLGVRWLKESKTLFQRFTEAFDFDFLLKIGTHRCEKYEVQHKFATLSPVFR